MKGIAVTTGNDGRRDFFWLDGGFGMRGSSPKRGLGFDLRFGGIFTSPPVAVATMARRDLVVSGDVLDPVGGRMLAGGGGGAAGTSVERAIAGESVATLDPETGTGTIARTGTRIDLGDVVGGLRPVTHRLDLFGLGLDFAMYHKRFWGEHDEDSLGSWARLGGIFTSAPAAINWGGRLDVFGLGMDHALYTMRSQGDDAGFPPDWQRLGGTFTSAPALVSRGPAQLDLFCRGADYTLRGNQTDGNTWFGWQNHGGNLASAPAVISWGADRIDIFAVFNDGTLRHRWWDGQIWNEWENLGGNYIGEPAVASWEPGRLDVFVVGAADRKLHHHWFEAQTWSLPEILPLGTEQAVAETPTVISRAADRLELFVPTADRQIRIVRWQGSNWEFSSTGAHLRIPGRYRFSVDHVRVDTTRALNADTDAAMCSVAPGNVKPMIRTQWIGEIGGLGSPDESQTNLLDVEPVSVDLAEPMSFSYLVVNNGHADRDKILQALAAAGDSLSLSGSSSMQEQIAQGIAQFVQVKLLAATAISVPVVGSILALAEKWVLGKLSAAIFKSCDGVVAVEMRAMMGRDLFIMTDHGRKTVTVTTVHPGTTSPTACGANSEYEVTWSIKPL